MKKLLLLCLLSFVVLNIQAQEAEQTEEEVQIQTDSSKVIIKTEKIIIQQSGDSNEESKAAKQEVKKQEKQINKAEKEEDIVFDEYIPPTFAIEEIEGSSTAGIFAGQTVFMPAINPKDAASKWSKTISEYKPGRKLSKEAKVHGFKDGEVKAIDMLIPAISTNLMNVYATFSEKDGGTVVNTYYDMGNGSYLTQGDNPTKYGYAETILNDYSRRVVRESIEDEIKDEEKTLSKIEKEQKKIIAEKGNLERKIEKNLENIERLKQEIIDAEADIVENLEMQKVKIKEVKYQSSYVDHVKGKLRKIK